jgi:hypothetical protein
MVKLRPGFGPRLAGRLWQLVAGAEALRRLCGLEAAAVGLRGAARTAFAELQLLLEDLQAPEMAATPGEALRLVVERFYRQWARDNLENAGSRIEDLEQLRCSRTATGPQHLSAGSPCSTTSRARTRSAAPRTRW